MEPTSEHPRWARGVSIAQGLLSLLFLALVAAPQIPLGVPGEWVWSRIAVRSQIVDLALAGLGVAGYIGLVVAVFRWLGRRERERPSGSHPLTWPHLAALLSLPALAILVQLALFWGAPPPFGILRWSSLGMPGASGYLTVAQREASGGLEPFLAEYPTWIKHQDALHIGTHPPGLIVAAHQAHSIVRDRPDRVRTILGSLPVGLRDGLRDLTPAMTAADRATVVLLGLATLILASLTVWPLYGLARSECGPTGAWAVAACWPLVPAVTLFHPTADTVYPLLSTLALALGAGSARLKGWPGAALALGGGLVMGVGMQLTLAFLAVGVVAAFVLRGRGGSSRWCPPGWLARLLATGVGFVAVTLAFWVITGANPLAIWWANQANHARFYIEYPRSYLAWLVVNPIELAVSLGGAASVAIVVGLWLRKRDGIGVAITTLGVLALLSLTGRNLSEVARLWLPLMPGLLVALGAWAERSSPRAVGFCYLFQGVQALVFLSILQTIYPVDF